MTGQAKYKQFIKIAEKRTQRVLEDLEALGNCSNPPPIFTATITCVRSSTPSTKSSPLSKSGFRRAVLTAISRSD